MRSLQAIGSVFVILVIVVPSIVMMLAPLIVPCLLLAYRFVKGTDYLRVTGDPGGLATLLTMFYVMSAFVVQKYSSMALMKTRDGIVECRDLDGQSVLRTERNRVVRIDDILFAEVYHFGEEHSGIPMPDEHLLIYSATGNFNLSPLHAGEKGVHGAGFYHNMRTVLHKLPPALVFERSGDHQAGRNRSDGYKYSMNPHQITIWSSVLTWVLLTNCGFLLTSHLMNLPALAISAWICIFMSVTGLAGVIIYLRKIMGQAADCISASSFLFIVNSISTARRCGGWFVALVSGRCLRARLKIVRTSLVDKRTARALAETSTWFQGFVPQNDHELANLVRECSAASRSVTR